MKGVALARLMVFERAEYAGEEAAVKGKAVSRCCLVGHTIRLPIPFPCLSSLLPTHSPCTFSQARREHSRSEPVETDGEGFAAGERGEGGLN